MGSFFTKKSVWPVAPVLLILGGALAAAFAFSHSRLKIEPLFGGHSPVEGLAAAMAENSAALYQEFVCSCCGKSIADCSCGEAGEKRAFLDKEILKGGRPREVEKAMVKEYGERILFDKALAAEIKKEIVAAAPKRRPRIVIKPERRSLGDVPRRKIINVDFKVKNEGWEDLVITGLESSCGCTTARIINGGSEGPIFGMAGHNGFRNPRDWSTRIGPGRAAVLRVFYDPNFHDGLRGSVTRTITVFSNDPIDPKVRAAIELNQID